MAHAVCIQCGDTKAKALDACPACAFEPATTHDKAQSMVATTHCMAERKLEKYAAARMRGDRAELPFELVMEYMDMFDGRSEPAAPVRLPSRGCMWMIFVWVLVGLWLVVMFNA